MKKERNYILLEAHKPADLVRSVNEKIEAGYRVSGGVCVDADYPKYFQAMIKKPEVKSGVGYSEALVRFEYAASIPGRLAPVDGAVQIVVNSKEDWLQCDAKTKAMARRKVSEEYGIEPHLVEFNTCDLYIKTINERGEVA